MRRSKFRRPCKVLIFNGARVLVAIVRSLHCAAELTHENKSAIHNCCTGKSVRSGGKLLPPTAPWYPIGDGRFGQSDTQRVWRLVWHQTKVHLHTENGAYSPEGKGKAESEDCHLPPGNELTTTTIKALGGCNDAQNKCPLCCSFLISLLFGIFPSLRGGDFILVVATGLTWGKYH